MNTRNFFAAAAVTALLATTAGCSVMRGQSTTGAYIDDSAITAAVKAKFVDSTDVDAAAIHVETLNGTVQLSGFAKNATEKNMAGTIASRVDNVKSVKNDIQIKP